MTYTEAIQAANAGSFIRHESWLPGEYARKANISDMDYFPHASDPSFLDDALVFDCPKPMDCRISICSPTKQEQQSDGWSIK